MRDCWPERTACCAEASFAPTAASKPKARTPASARRPNRVFMSPRPACNLADPGSPHNRDLAPFRVPIGRYPELLSRPGVKEANRNHKGASHASPGRSEICLYPRPRSRLGRAVEFLRAARGRARADARSRDRAAPRGHAVLREQLSDRGGRTGGAAGACDQGAVTRRRAERQTRRAKKNGPASSGAVSFQRSVNAVVELGRAGVDVTIAIARPDILIAAVIGRVVVVVEVRRVEVE